MVYRVFSSLKTSVIILGGMCIFYLLGTIFPQGVGYEEYAQKGGRFLPLVKTLGLLDIFISPGFIFLSGLLAINLLVCIYDRFRVFLRRPKFLPYEAFFKNQSLNSLGTQDIEKVINTLKKMGFREIISEKDIYVFQKGIPYWWLSWIYHIGMVIAIVGFILTAIFSFENEVVLHKGKEEKISLYSPDTRWNKFLSSLGKEVPKEKKQKEYYLNLKDFKAEYYQSLKLDYPKEKLSRLAFGLGLRADSKPSKPTLMPKLWLSKFELKTPEGKVLDAEVEVNKPFRAEGVTLYQMGYEQSLTLRVDGKQLIVNTMEPFEIKGIDGEFKTSSLKSGKVYKKDGTIDEIEPYFELFFTPKGGKRESLGELKLNGSLSIKGKKIYFSGFDEASVLSYRVDPGVSLLEISIWLVFIGLFLRSMGRYYKVQIGIRDREVFFTIATRGLFADRQSLIERLRERLSNNV